MHCSSTRKPRLACFASGLAALALSVGFTPSLIAETATFQGKPVEVLGRSTTKIPGGSVTFIRIRPPVAAPVPATPPPAPSAPLSVERVAALEREDKRTFSSFSVTATVYTRVDGSVAVTELTWRKDEQCIFRAWSTADFRLLRQLWDIPLENHRFQWFPFINSVPLSEVAGDQQPIGLQLFPEIRNDDDLPEYFFEGTEPEANAAALELAALDWLHAFYHLNKKSLAEDLAKREAAAAEHARKAAEDAAKPKNHTVFFWKID